MWEQLNPGFAVAAVLAVATAGLHTFEGGKEAARPLLGDTTLPAASKWLNYLTWHMVTVLILIMAGGFLWAALDPAAVEAALLLMVVALALSLVTVAVALKAGIRPWMFPSSWLFLIILGCGLWGLSSQP